MNNNDIVKRVIEKITRQVVNEMLDETSRRQKAVAALNGTNSKVKTMAILTSESPRYEGFADGDNTTNAQRRENLEKDLKLGHYAWFPVKGRYEEETENSYIIYNIPFKTAQYLSKKYGQKAFIFIVGSHCEYWEQNDNGRYVLMSEKEMNQRLDMTDADDMYTQISRGFKFQIPFFDGSDENKDTMGESIQYVNKVINKRIPNLTEAQRRIETTLIAPSGYDRFCDRGMLYGNNFVWD